MAVSREFSRPSAGRSVAAYREIAVAAFSTGLASATAEVEQCRLHRRGNDRRFLAVKSLIDAPLGA
jgi:hypothetical protein